MASYGLLLQAFCVKYKQRLDWRLKITEMKYNVLMQQKEQIYKQRLGYPATVNFSHIGPRVIKLRAPTSVLYVILAQERPIRQHGTCLIRREYDWRASSVWSVAEGNSKREKYQKCTSVRIDVGW